jgi:hypothetical protein
VIYFSASFESKPIPKVAAAKPKKVVPFPHLARINPDKVKQTPRSKVIPFENKKKSKAEKRAEEVAAAKDEDAQGRHRAVPQCGKDTVRYLHDQGHKETYPIESTQVERVLRHQFTKLYGVAIPHARFCRVGAIAKRLEGEIYEKESRTDQRVYAHCLHYRPNDGVFH